MNAPDLTYNSDGFGALWLGSPAEHKLPARAVGEGVTGPVDFVWRDEDPQTG